jgi:predicted O-methyltransferase YrrM
VELGVLNGQSAACMGVELINHGLASAQIVLIDTNLPKELEATLAPIAHVLGPKRRGISWEQAAAFEDASLDYVMIDADHAYEAVAKDIAAWLPKIRPGGILAGHDYTPEIPGVCQAVTEAFETFHISRGERFRGPRGDQPPGNYYPVWWVER